MYLYNVYIALSCFDVRVDVKVSLKLSSAGPGFAARLSSGRSELASNSINNKILISRSMESSLVFMIGWILNVYIMLDKILVAYSIYKLELLSWWCNIPYFLSWQSFSLPASLKLSRTSRASLLTVPAL